MLIGQSIVAPTVSTKYYTPWSARQGNECTVVIQVIKASGALSTFTCQVQTKNTEDSDFAATNVGTAFAISSGTTTAVRSGFKELVRYEITVAGSGAAQWVHLRSNPPIWEPN